MAPTLIGTGSRDGESAMSTPARCPSCGALRPASAPEGLCPRCVLRHAIESGGPSDCESAHDWSRTGPVLKTLAMTVGSVPRVQLVDVESTAGLEPRERVDRYEDEDNLSQASHLGSSSVSVPLGADGRLELLGEIARGGMGAVLRGRDTDLGRDLAVKVLLETHKDQPNLVGRFLEEAQITGQLQHPGIVPVYEVGASPTAGLTSA